MIYDQKYFDALEYLYNQPFCWGSQDCCLGVANFYRDVTGIDIGAQWRGKYNTALGALRLLKEGGGMRKMLMNAGFRPINAKLACRGDVVIYSGEKFDGYDETMGVVGSSGKDIVMAGGYTRPISKASEGFTLKGTT